MLRSCLGIAVLLVFLIQSSVYDFDILPHIILWNILSMFKAKKRFPVHSIFSIALHPLQFKDSHLNTLIGCWHCN